MCDVWILTDYKTVCTAWGSRLYPKTSSLGTGGVSASPFPVDGCGFETLPVSDTGAVACSVSSVVLGTLSVSLQN